MPQVHLINALLQQASASGTKSTALKPLGWMLAILLSGTMTSFYINTPQWLGLTLLVLSVITFLLYFYAYVYFMHNDRDALRSEKYSLEKMAIQRGLIGDDISGVLSEGGESSQRLIESPSNQGRDSGEQQ